MLWFPTDVPGWLTYEEGLFLYRLSHNKRVLEIGSFRGRSTICLAQSAAEVHSVDNHAGDAHIGPQDSLADFVANLIRYEVMSKVLIHVGPCDSLLHHFTESYFDLVFVDGSHDETSVRLDLCHATRVTKLGGAIAMHDWSRPGVRAAAARHGFTVPERFAGDIAAFDRSQFTTCKS